MAKLTTKKVLEALEAVGFYGDLTRHKDGTFSAKHGFFYREQGRLEWLEGKVEKAGFRVVESREDWKPWPKDSNYVVRFEAK